MLAKSPTPNVKGYAIHNKKNFFDVLIDPKAELETINGFAKFIEKYGELGAELLIYTGDCLEDAKRYIEENYEGEYESEEAFARQIAEGTMGIPDHIEFYFDYKQFAYDLFISDYRSVEVGGKTHVFKYEY